MRIAVIDDQALFRDGLASLLRARGHEVVGEAADGESGLALVRESCPDLVLLDLKMGGLDGLATMRLLSGEAHPPRVVILTVSEDERDLIEAMKSGAQGYLLKDIDAHELFDAIDAAGRGESVVTPRLARLLWREFERLKDALTPSGPDQLTPREWEVLRLVGQGGTNRDVAAQLDITEHTVKFHMRVILRKLHLHNRAQVAAWNAQYERRRR